ncbi:MAG: DUF1580 domain-containing protein [Planctomycetota bacterium]|jgi:hypothetical protein
MQQNEPLHPLSLAVEKATGRRPHITTCLRWATRGVAGIRLETSILGGRRLTSEQAVRRFMDRVTEAKELSRSSQPAPLSIVTPRAAKRAAEKLAREISPSKNNPQIS